MAISQIYLKTYLHSVLKSTIVHLVSSFICLLPHPIETSLLPPSQQKLLKSPIIQMRKGRFTTSSREGNGYGLQYSCLENCMKRSLVG